LFRVIAGLLDAQSGDVRLAGESILVLPTQERRIALVFQDDALFNKMTVRENFHFAIRNRSAASDAGAYLHVQAPGGNSPVRTEASDDGRADDVVTGVALAEGQPT
jgi:ABC-type sugar transport system ATPase subunit